MSTKKAEMGKRAAEPGMLAVWYYATKLPVNLCAFSYSGVPHP